MEVVQPDACALSLGWTCMMSLSYFLAVLFKICNNKERSTWALFDFKTRGRIWYQKTGMENPIWPLRKGPISENLIRAQPKGASPALNSQIC